MKRTRTGQFAKPDCPNCGHKLRVKPQPRTAPQQVWQCAECAKTRPDESEWTNFGLEMAVTEAEEDRMERNEAERDIDSMHAGNWVFE